MKLQVLQEKLSKALAISSRFASTKAQLPILGNILLSAKKTKLSISATNLETSIALSIGAQVEKEGEITIPARTITDLVSNLPAGPIELSAKREQLSLSSESFSSSISGMNVSDFPSIPQKAGKGVIKLPSEEFVDSLYQVSFAASNDETRPVLTGVLFIFKKGSLTMVATDGFRLSQKKIKLKGTKTEKDIVLPKTPLTELMRVAGDNKDLSFSFREGDNQVVFGADDTALTSRILEGEFPDFKKIIPKDSQITINLDKEEFLRAIRLASVFARDSANIVKISVKKDVIEVLAESQTSGSEKTLVDAKTKGSLKEEFEIAFNYRFLEDFLNAIKGEEVKIELSTQTAPGTFTDPKDTSFLHLIMPVRIQT